MSDTIKAFVDFLTRLFAALAKFLGVSEEFEDLQAEFQPAEDAEG